MCVDCQQNIEVSVVNYFGDAANSRYRAAELCGEHTLEVIFRLVIGNFLSVEPHDWT